MWECTFVSFYISVFTHSYICNFAHCYIYTFVTIGVCYYAITSYAPVLQRAALPFSCVLVSTELPVHSNISLHRLLGCDQLIVVCSHLQGCKAVGSRGMPAFLHAAHPGNKQRSVALLARAEAMWECTLLYFHIVTFVTFYIVTNLHFYICNFSVNLLYRCLLFTCAFVCSTPLFTCARLNRAAGSQQYSSASVIGV